MNKSLFVLLLACLLPLLLTTAVFATEPAVAKVNGRIDAMRGQADIVTNNNDIWNVSGNLAIPITHQIGTQVELGTGEIEANSVEADMDRYGVHLFTRNPELGLAGIFASHLEIENYDIDRLGIEGEYYAGLMTVAAMLAQQDTDASDDLLGSLDLRWYPLDELMLEIGASFIESDKKMHLGAEYQLLQSLGSYTDLALSAYADLAVGDDSYDQALIGLRTYFGSPKSLAKRHRQDQLNVTTDQLK